MKVLNLYAGIGGNRKLWEDVEVTEVELNEEIAGVYKKENPNDEVVIADAHEYLKNNYKGFDFIWDSISCQKHSRMMKATRHDVADYPDMNLYAEIIFLKHFFKGLWVVENVAPYYEPLIKPDAIIGRHYLWSNFKIGQFDMPNKKGFITKGTLKEAEELNHCPGQVLRNCVHPEIGLYILDCARGIINRKNKVQTSLEF